MSQFRLVNSWVFVPGADGAIATSAREALNVVGEAYRALRHDPEGYQYYTPYGADFNDAVAAAVERVDSAGEPWLIVIITDSTVSERLEVMNLLDYLTQERDAFVVVVPLEGHVSGEMSSLLSGDPADLTLLPGIDVINLDGLRNQRRAFERVGPWAVRRSS